MERKEEGRRGEKRGREGNGGLMTETTPVVLTDGLTFKK